jgi:hypothetical protein
MGGFVTDGNYNYNLLSKYKNDASTISHYASPFLLRDMYFYYITNLYFYNGGNSNDVVATCSNMYST